MDLQCLDQGHKVPDRKGMMGHKNLHLLQGLDGPVERMGQKALPLGRYIGQKTVDGGLIGIRHKVKTRNK